MRYFITSSQLKLTGASNSVKANAVITSTGSYPSRAAIKQIVAKNLGITDLASIAEFIVINIWEVTEKDLADFVKET